MDASAAALPDAAEDALPELRHCPDEDAEKLAGPGPDVQAPDAQVPQLGRLAQLARAVPCTPDEARCGARSCAATAFAAVAAQPAPSVSLLLESQTAAV